LDYGPIAQPHNRARAGLRESPLTPGPPGCPKPPPKPVRAENQGDPITQCEPPQEPRPDLRRHADRIAPAVRPRIRPVRGGKIQVIRPMRKGPLTDLPDSLMKAVAGA